jgi:glycosyltransferase involved in cell wall biosynthesis
VAARRLSIAVIPAWYPTRARPLSGVFVREHALAAMLHDDVAILVDDGPDASVRWLYELGDELEDGLRTFRIRYRRSRIPMLTAAGYLGGILAALRRLRREGHPADLLHAHVHRAAWAAAIVAALTRRPFVVSEHSSEFGWSGIRDGALRRARIAFARADLVCPVSEYLRGQLEAHGVRARFRVVPNTVDTGVFRPSERAPEDRPPRMITVASLEPKKGIDHLLRALGILSDTRPDFALDLVGDGPHREEYEELARRLGIEDRVVFHGASLQAEVVRLMRGADVLVMPSLTENLPLAIIEAMACGLPVVASRVGGIPEMVDDQTGVLVPPADAAALAGALVELLSRRGDYSSELIAELARSRWSLPVVGEMWSELYRGVLAARAAR